MDTTNDSPGPAAALLARMRAYYFPNGEAAAHSITQIRTTQRGEIRLSRNARWNAFTAEESVDATRSRFCWNARMGSNVITSVKVTDAYEDGRGRLVVKKGPIQLQKLAGPEVDKGELQRYLAYVSYCSPMLLNHATLEWSAAGPSTLRVRDRLDAAGTWVDVDIAGDGRIVGTRAERPMTVGKQIVLMPWSTGGSEEREWEGLRMPTHLEASWHPPEGAFTYIRIELLSLEVVR